MNDKNAYQVPQSPSQYQTMTSPKAAPELAYETLKSTLGAAGIASEQVGAKLASDALAHLAQRFLAADAGSAIESLVRVGVPALTQAAALWLSTRESIAAQKSGAVLGAASNAVLVGSMAVVGERTAASLAENALEAFGDFRAKLGGGKMPPPPPPALLPETAESLRNEMRAEVAAATEPLKAMLQELLARK